MIPGDITSGTTSGGEEFFAVFLGTNEDGTARLSVLKQTNHGVKVSATRGVPGTVYDPTLSPVADAAPDFATDLISPPPADDTEGVPDVDPPAGFVDEDGVHDGK